MLTMTCMIGISTVELSAMLLKKYINHKLVYQKPIPSLLVFSGHKAKFLSMHVDNMHHCLPSIVSIVVLIVTFRGEFWELITSLLKF